MKKSKKIFISVASIILIIIVVIGIHISTQYLNGIDITQLSPQGSRQMMGYIMKTKNDTFILVDGGTEVDSENLKKHVDKHNGVVNYWFITHAHDDHIGAMVSLLEQGAVKIENIVCSLNDLEWYKQNEEERADIVERLYNILNVNNDIVIKQAQLNEQIYIDNIKVKILGVKNPEITQNVGNNQSMVFKVYVNNKTILFLGDTGEESSKKLIQANKDELKSDVVQMAHHGQAGATEEIYQLVKPQICLWPTPEWLWDNNLNGQGYNTGNWKTLETREWIEKLNVKTNYVAKDGEITIRIW